MRVLYEIDDETPVHRVARAYGIRLLRTAYTRDMCKSEFGGFVFGPQGGAYNPLRREVLVARDQRHEKDHDAQVLHEIAHCVTAVPFTHHDRVPEEYVLLPWELELAKVSGVDMGRYLAYRATTRIRSDRSKRFREIDNPERTGWWNDGWCRAVRVGILTGVSRVVPGAWPNWNKLIACDRAELLQWREKGHA